MLVGDAGFFRDPATSHGISDAFRDAELAAQAALGGSQWAMDAYQEARDAFAYPVLEATDAVCGFDWTPEKLKGHHKRLSQVIKAEVAFLADRGTGSHDDGAHPVGRPVSPPPSARRTGPDCETGRPRAARSFRFGSVCANDSKARE